MSITAEKRMFTKKITESDAFLDMPMSTQCLYFHLNMNADDDGFVNNPKMIKRNVGASDDDLKLLLSKRFILAFESGVIVIKHWRMHNTLRHDRHIATDYQEEFAQLGIKENKSYTLVANGLPNGCQMVAIDKNRIEENRIDKNRLDKVKEPVTYFPDEDLNKCFLDFLDERKANKVKNTDRAITLLVNKLNTLSDGNTETAKAILNQSIENGWKGLFELKGSKTKKQESLQDFADSWDV